MFLPFSCKKKKTAGGKFKTALIISHLSHGVYPMLWGQLKSPKHFLVR